MQCIDFTSSHAGWRDRKIDTRSSSHSENESLWLITYPVCIGSWKSLMRWEFGVRNKNGANQSIGPTSTASWVVPTFPCLKGNDSPDLWLLGSYQGRRHSCSIRHFKLTPNSQRVNDFQNPIQTGRVMSQRGVFVLGQQSISLFTGRMRQISLFCSRVPEQNWEGAYMGWFIPRHT